MNRVIFDCFFLYLKTFISIYGYNIKLKRSIILVESSEMNFKYMYTYNLVKHLGRHISSRLRHMEHAHCGNTR